MAKLLVGCAGWSYKDWVGPVYPPLLPARNWLDAYASRFPVVEIDSTFYALPSPSTVRGWLERVRTHRGFTFAAKVPQTVTHEHLPRGETEAAEADVNAFRERLVEPLESADRLEAILVQLPPTYALPRDAQAWTPLRRILDGLGAKRRRIAVEFRHSSFYVRPGGPLAEAAWRQLQDAGAIPVHVDGLGFQFTKTRGDGWAYFRLHGRRTEIPKEERGLPHAPYDYLYSKPELAEISERIRHVVEGMDHAVVIFNNHYQGKAPQNATEMMRLLGVKPVRQRQSRLD